MKPHPMKSPSAKVLPMCLHITNISIAETFKTEYLQVETNYKKKISVRPKKP